jgi:hypothetical protein
MMGIAKLRNCGTAELKKRRVPINDLDELRSMALQFRSPAVAKFGNQ